VDTMAKGGTGDISSPDFPKTMKYMSRGELMAAASDAITYLHTRTCSGKQFKESATDKARAAYLRVLIQAIAAYGGLLRDAELDELKRRIEALEMVKGKGTDNK
jgi:hypothetical protein